MATKEVITNNLPHRGLKIVVNLFLWAKALLSYPLPYFAAVEQMENTFFRGKPKTILPPCYDSEDSLKMWALVLRLSLVVFTVLMAIFIPHFNILMGLIGSFTGNMLSLVWPCYFHLKIKGHSLSWYSKLTDCVIILFGLVCCLLGVYYSTHALVLAFKGIEPRPFQGRGSLPVQAKQP
jgi:vesicular inhibitory amino acid transporter